MGEQFENNYTTTLNGGINNSTTSITVAAGPTTLTGSFRIKIDNEIIYVGTASGTSFTNCTRGAEGTTAASHSDGATVKHILTAASLTVDSVSTTEHGSLTGMIIIPGLRGSPDIRVGGGNDQEFDSSTIGGTALGSPTTIDTNTTVLSNLYIKKSATAGFSLNGRYWSTPSTPFTMTAKLTDWSNTKANYMRAALGVAESTPGKTEAIYIDGAGSNGQAGVGVISSTTPSSGAAYVQAGNTADNIYSSPIYFRCVVTSTTNISWYYSRSGLIWTPMVTGRNPGFTIGSYFVSVHPENGTYDMAIAVDWIRFT